MLSWEYYNSVDYMPGRLWNQHSAIFAIFRLAWTWAWIGS